jgi:hypothetical protein
MNEVIGRVSDWVIEYFRPRETAKGLPMGAHFTPSVIHSLNHSIAQSLNH